MKKHLAIMHIHSCSASWSSEDKSLYREVYDIPHGEFHHEGDDLLSIYTFEDKTYYWENIRARATKEQMIALVSKYVGEGWSTKVPVILDEYVERCRQRCLEKRKAMGSVIIDSRDFHDHFDRAVLQGSLSDELWAVPNCVRYTSNYCHGYYGHSARTHDIDKFIEAEFKRQGATLDEIDIWMSSSYARHAMDYHEGESFEVWKPFIIERVPSWILQAKEMLAEKEVTV